MGCAETSLMCTVTVLFFVYVIVLFEFADSGFFSHAGYAKWLMLIGAIIKMVFGAKMFAIGQSKDVYGRLQKIFAPKRVTIDAESPKGITVDVAQTQESQGVGGYNMEPIHAPESDVTKKEET